MAKRIRSVLQRLVMAAFGASVIAALFLGLKTLTAGGGQTGPAIAVRQVDLKPVRPERKAPIEVRKKVRPPPPSELPKLTPLETDVGGEERIPVERIARAGPPTLAFTALRSASGLQGSDAADPQPILRIPPEYPPSGRGEGWVLVQFDITPAGTVANVSTVDAQPRGMFEKSALRAIERWRYRPAVMEGRAVERRGLRVMLRFELETA